MKWEVFFSSLVRMSDILVVPSIFWIYMFWSFTCYLNTFSLMVMWRKPFVVLVLEQSTHAWLSLKIGINREIRSRIPRSFRMFWRYWENLTHSSVALISDSVEFLAVMVCLLEDQCIGPYRYIRN